MMQYKDIILNMQRNITKHCKGYFNDGLIIQKKYQTSICKEEPYWYTKEAIQKIQLIIDQ